MKHPFHEWPLVIFTTLAILGGGLLMIPGVTLILGWRAADSDGSAQLVGAALLAAGLLVSLAHLGQPQRAPLAIAGLRRSRLSLEIVLAVATIAAAAGSLAFAEKWPTLTVLSAALAAAFLLSLGLVYALPGQLTWRGAVVLTPLTSGFAFCTLSFAAMPGALGIVLPVAPLVLAPDACAFLLRWRRVSRLGRAGARPYAWEPTVLLAARFALVDLVPCCLLLAALPKGAAGAAGLGILVDRLGFYLLAVQHTTESEIAATESGM